MLRLPSEITKSRPKKGWPDRINTKEFMIFTQSRRSQNNPARGSENHRSSLPPSRLRSVSLTHSLSLFPALSFLLFPTPLAGVLLLVTSHGLNWSDCQSVPDSDSAKSSKV